MGLLHLCIWNFIIENRIILIFKTIVTLSILIIYEERTYVSLAA